MRSEIKRIIIFRTIADDEKTVEIVGEVMLRDDRSGVGLSRSRL